MNKFVAATVTTSLLAAPVMAQAPSDQTLFAAYCLGSTDVLAKQFAGTEVQPELQDRRRRFGAYLLLHADEDWMLGYARGVEDGRACLSAVPNEVARVPCERVGRCTKEMGLPF